MKKVKYLYLFFIFIVFISFSSNSIAVENDFITNKRLSSLVPDEIAMQPKINPPKLETEKMGEEIPDWIARWELARILSYLKKYDESVIEYKKLIKDKPELYEAKVEMANVLLWSGDEKGSIFLLNDIPLDKLNDDGKLLIADIYAMQKKYDKAESMYREYLGDYPDKYNVRVKLAEILSWAGDLEGSIIEYEKVLKVKPDDVQVRRKYAFVLIWSSRHSEAAAELRKTLK